MKNDADLMRAHEWGQIAADLLPKLETVLDEQQRLIDREAFARIKSEGSISPDEALRFWYTKFALTGLPQRLKKQTRIGVQASEAIGNKHTEGTEDGRPD